MEAIPTLVILLVASIVVFATAADWCSNDRFGAGTCTGRIGWAIAAGVVSSIVCLLMIVLHKVHLERTRRGNVIVATLLIIWWAFAAGYLTTGDGPFTDTNNGYYATWIAFIASVYYLYISIAALRGVTFTFGHALALVLLASIVEFAVAANTCRGATSCTGRWGWAVAVGVISTVICLALIFMHFYVNEMAEKSAMLVGPLLVVLWAFGAGFNTSASGPFPYPSRGLANGYYFTWLALFASVYYAASALPGVREALRTNSGHAEPAWVGQKVGPGAAEAGAGVGAGTSAARPAGGL